MPDITLNPSDAAELTELLAFTRDAITSDHKHLNTSLTRFIGHRGYDLAQLHTDLDRFTLLLRGNDGETLSANPTNRSPSPPTTHTTARNWRVTL